MSKIALSGPASGTATYTISAPTGATDRTITLPDVTGTLLSTASTFGGTGPAFLATQSSATSITNGVTTKVLFDVEAFDTNSNFASSRFTPTVAGYYQINGNVTINAGVGTNIVFIYKNGSDYLRGGRNQSSSSPAGMTISAVVYLNGSTDYVEIYAFTNGGTALTEAGTTTNFSGAMIRSAT